MCFSLRFQLYFYSLEKIACSHFPRKSESEHKCERADREYKRLSRDKNCLAIVSQLSRNCLAIVSQLSRSQLSRNWLDLGVVALQKKLSRDKNCLATTKRPQTALWERNSQEQCKSQINMTSRIPNIYSDTCMEPGTTNYISSRRHKSTMNLISNPIATATGQDVQKRDSQSTTGTVLQFAGVTIATSSKTQHTIAQSSAEAEL
eukprot:3339849-Amphidinium_carterae.4